MFRSRYNHTIDAKGRLIIPQKFREELGDHFVVTKGMDGCLFVYTDEAMDKLEEKLQSLPLTNKDSRMLARFFTINATAVDVDKQGRILIPSYLKEYAGLEKDVILAGVGSRVEIWDRVRWEKMDNELDMDAIAASMEEMGIKF